MPGPGNEAEAICTRDRISMSTSQMLHVNLLDIQFLSDCMYQICRLRLFGFTNCWQKISRSWQNIDFDLQMAATACFLNCSVRC